MNSENNGGFSLIELIISITLISIMSISIGRFVNQTVFITKSIDDSLMVEDSINYASDFIKEYIECMEGIESIDINDVILKDGVKTYDFYRVSFYNMNYWDDKCIYFRLNKKKKILSEEVSKYGLSFQKSNRIKSRPDDNKYIKAGAELIDYSLDNILVIPLPIGTEIDDADGIKLIYVLEGRSSVYEFEKSYYFKNKRCSKSE